MHKSSTFEITRYYNGKDNVIPFKIPFTDHEESDTPIYYVAYTEELWTMLEGLRKAMKELQKRIIKSLGSEQNRRQLIADVVGHMLPPAPDLAGDGEWKKGKKEK